MGPGIKEKLRLKHRRDNGPEAEEKLISETEIKYSGTQYLEHSVASNRCVQL